MDPVTSTLTRLHKARLARIAAGSALILTAPAMLLGSLDRLGLHVLAAGWAVSLFLLLATRLLPAPRHSLARQTDRLATWSLRLPLIGLSLLMPLTLHALFMLLVGDLRPRDFSEWALISALVVGQAHIALAWFSAKDAVRMIEEPGEISWKLASWNTLWKTVLASCVPSVLLLAVPPLLTLLTGAAFIPAMYWLSTGIGSRERIAEDWLGLSDRLGLTAEPEPAPRLPALTGIIDGIRVSLDGWWELTGHMMFDLEVALATPELLHLTISADPAAPADLKTGESVADSVLRISSSGSQNVAPLVARMQDPECYAALMEVVHGQGGTLARGRIHLQLRARSLAPVWEALPKMIDLSRLLQQPPALSVEPEEAVSQPLAVGQASPAG